MQLTIITPANNSTVAIEWLEVTTLSGNTIIQPGHAPMITLLSADKPALYLPAGQQDPVSRPVAGQTIMHVTRTSVTLICSE